MSALSTSETRDEWAATASTARFTTSITSSHSPSMLVNIALVWWGRPESRTTRMASATAAETLPSSSDAAGLTLKARSIAPSSPDAPSADGEGDTRGVEVERAGGGEPGAVLLADVEVDVLAAAQAGRELV